MIRQWKQDAPLLAPSVLAARLRPFGRRSVSSRRGGRKGLAPGYYGRPLCPEPEFRNTGGRSSDLDGRPSCRLDVHLMISEPEKYVGRFRDAGADALTIHIEPVDDPTPVLEEIRSLVRGSRTFAQSTDAGQ